MKVLKPDMICESVQSIDLQKLKMLGIKGIALDTDNTLIDYKRFMPFEVKEWVKLAKSMEFRVCILSNSNSIDKMEFVSKELELEYINFAKKPFQSGYKKAIKLLNLEPKEIAMVGDQIFTDVLGANIMNMFSIYVVPINKKEPLYTSFKRPFEAIILKKEQ